MHWKGEAFGHKTLGLNHNWSPECFAPAHPQIKFFVNYLFLTGSLVVRRLLAPDPQTNQLMEWVSRGDRSIKGTISRSSIPKTACMPDSCFHPNSDRPTPKTWVRSPLFHYVTRRRFTWIKAIPKNFFQCIRAILREGF